ncbi:hypothetical protein ACIQTW_05830 [Paenarthrobacter sp. NPDC090517]|uniref:hypothetical protein n=1 Tax=Paenarthrobacter sp. NPDC090517 TaxID=3364381 RepID=UPI0037F31821
MTDPVRRQAVLMPAPRHLRRRRFRSEISTSLMGGYQTPAPGKRSGPPAPRSANSSGEFESSTRDKTSLEDPQEPRDTALLRKRRIALLIVILVSVTIPVLVLALMFGQ